MQPMVHTALRAAREAGKLILRGSENLDRLRVAEKSRNDFVSEIDRAAEQKILEQLKRAYPQHAFIAEESGHTGADPDKTDFVWHIDPLDGTTNFLRGFPHYCISMCCLHRGQLEHAIVYDPVRTEEFTASRGAGAQLNGRRIRVTDRHNLDGTLLGTGFPFRESQAEWAPRYFNMLETLAGQTAGVRRAGSAALDLAYVAAGRFDGFWEYGLKSWDMAAGALLILEAGGLVTDFDGGEDFLSSGNIVCGNPKVQAILLELLKSQD